MTARITTCTTSSPRSAGAKFLRRHHMTHHFADHARGFGETSPLWDYVFRTVPKKKGASPLKA